MKTLYVSDLDGTLLGKGERISEYSLRNINDLIKKGTLFTYATARSLSSASVVAQGLFTKIPVIVYNGAFLIEADTRKIISKEVFSKEETISLIETMKQYGVSPLVYSFVDGLERVSWKVGTENVPKRRYLDSRNGDKRMRVVATDEMLYMGEMFYFTILGWKEELEDLYHHIGKDDRFTSTFQMDIYNENEWWLEIMPKKATKADAILKLKHLLGCDEVVSFGDAINDMPMFQISDRCYAVENAVDELKSIATEQIESHLNDGVAKWLLKSAV